MSSVLQAYDSTITFVSAVIAQKLYLGISVVTIYQINQAIISVSALNTVRESQNSMLAANLRRKNIITTCTTFAFVITALVLFVCSVLYGIERSMGGWYYFLAFAISVLAFLGCLGISALLLKTGERLRIYAKQHRSKLTVVLRLIIGLDRPFQSGGERFSVLTTVLMQGSLLFFSAMKLVLAGFAAVHVI